MAEAMQINRMLLRLRAGEPDRPTLCRIVRNVAELTTVGREFFSACDPVDDDGRRLALFQMEDKLAKIDVSVCSKPTKFGPGKRA